MVDQQLFSEDSEKKKMKIIYTWTPGSVHYYINIIKRIYNLLLNANQIPMYNTAFIQKYLTNYNL